MNHFLSSAALVTYKPPFPDRYRSLVSQHRWSGLSTCWPLFVTALLMMVSGRWGMAAETAAAASIRRGEVQYEVPQLEHKVAPRFQLPAHRFDYEEELLPAVSDRIGISHIRFPSPVQTAVERNNTVHCEYFYPKREGRAPGVIVLHILGGDFPLARLFANSLAQHGVAALFLKMPYYGERRDPNSSRRMISKDPQETVEGMTQAVLDIRQATAWLATRPEIDAQQLGIFGISLGGITGALAATAEPRLQNVCLLLAGGDIGRIAWESKELSDVRKGWLATGGSREEFLKRLQSIDPVRYGENVQGRRILLLNATADEVIPKACTESLWESFGKPEIVWYSGGHYSVARHLLSALDRSSRFFTVR
ncbi:MAG: alpha/beta hydrolase family protein [Planctomycetota bacterium]